MFIVMFREYTYSHLIYYIYSLLNITWRRDIFMFKNHVSKEVIKANATMPPSSGVCETDYNTNYMSFYACIWLMAI